MFLIKFNYFFFFSAALKLFLNSETGLCRALIMKFLSSLWAVQTWARTQTSLRLYSSSLLMVYDARRLKNSMFFSRNSSNSSTASPNGSMSPSSVDGKLTPTSMFQWPQSNQITNGHHSDSIVGNNVAANVNGGGGGGNISGETIQLYKKLQRSHSTQNNYDEVSFIILSMENNEFLMEKSFFLQDLKDIRKDYTFLLDNLIGGYNDNKEWAYVKMIDFAHVFTAEDESIDKNYLFGIENLVKIFEEFLQECDQ